MQGIKVCGHVEGQLYSFVRRLTEAKQTLVWTGAVRYVENMISPLSVKVHGVTCRIPSPRT